MPERVHKRFEDDLPSPAKKPRLPVDVRKRSSNGTGPPPPADKKAGQVSSPAYPAPSKAEPGNAARFSTPPTNTKVRRPYNQQPQGDRMRPYGNLKEKAAALLQTRKQLPIWRRADAIREGLKYKDVMLLVGETGSGKSTQVPQFLADEPWCQVQATTLSENGSEKKAKVGGCIAITEPRRVAAISLARRVAEEMGTPLGTASPSSKVGYSVRFDNSTSPATKVKFLTEGMLLQEMLRDPWLRQYSAVVVDEVHERGVNVDLVMGFLRNMVTGKKEGRGGVPLKVVVMSATADMQGLLKFFEDGFGDGDDTGDAPEFLEHAGKDEESESEWSGLSDDEPQQEEKTSEMKFGTVNSQAASTNGDQEASAEKPQLLTTSKSVSICHISGRQYPVKLIYSPTPVPDIVDSALRTIFQINHGEPIPGDILVFLTGQSTVESLTSLVTEYAASLAPNIPRLLPLPLFAALPQSAQQRVFNPAPPRTRKVIISTNIAETSVTVPGVRFVIDSGKSKTKQFRSRLGLDSLLVKPISKSSATQRSGRAGREAPGVCYRLYTQSDYDALAQAAVPEILRCDLSHALLTLKARGVADLASFPFLSPPPRDSLASALLQLYQLDALTSSGTISALGTTMARLPLSAPLGRALLAAADPEMDCLGEMIDVLAALSVENIFLPLVDEESKEKAERARGGLMRREGDHLTQLAAVRAYLEEGADRRRWCEGHWVSHRAMQGVMDVRKQLLALAPTLTSASGFSASAGITPESDSGPLSPERATAILKCLVKGFGTNTALLMPDGSYKTVQGKQTVAIHPSSVLFGRKVEAIVYSEYVFTSKSYARGVSAVQMDWLG